MKRQLTQPRKIGRKKVKLSPLEKSLRKEFRKRGYDASDDDLQWVAGQISGRLVVDHAEIALALLAPKGLRTGSAVRWYGNCRHGSEYPTGTVVDYRSGSHYAKVKFDQPVTIQVDGTGDPRDDYRKVKSYNCDVRELRLL